MVVLTVLLTTSIVSELAALALALWRSVDLETHVLEVIGLVCIVAFVALLIYERRAS